MEGGQVKYDDDSRAVAASLGRHASLHVVCSNLHDMIVGDSAKELLDAPSDIPSHSGLFVAPSWVWRFPRIDVGHKGINSDGEAVRLPIRVTWTTSPVGFVTDSSVTASWQVNGMGHSGVGETHLATTTSTDTIGRPLGLPEANELPDEVVLETMTKGELVEALTTLVENGKKAQWALLSQLQPFVEAAVESAHKVVSAEVSPNGQPVLDVTGRENIVTTLMFGDPDNTDGSSIVLNLIGRCKTPGTFVKVDPWMYMRKAISSAAESAIRRSINDPHIGRKVRRVAEEIGTRDVEAVLAEYNKRYPNDRLAKKRALAALNAGSDAMATWSPLPEVSPLSERV